MKSPPAKNVRFCFFVGEFLVFLDIPLKIQLRTLLPKPKSVGDPVDGVVVDPRAQIRFECVAEGRPKPDVFYTWLPINDSSSGEVGLLVKNFQFNI